MSAATHLWDAKHSYYCTEGQFFSTQAHYPTIFEFGSWAEFFQEMGQADDDLNLLFRWDWQEGADFTGDVNYRNGRLKLFYMVQRKGYHTCSIVEVCRADEPAVRAYLEQKVAFLKSLWEPLT